MNHNKYKELEKKMDKLYSDFIDEAAEIENENDFNKVSKWVDNNFNLIFNWAKNNGAENQILNELKSDYLKLKDYLVFGFNLI